jgi:hypothetical protein
LTHHAGRRSDEYILVKRLHGIGLLRLRAICFSTWNSSGGCHEALQGARMERLTAYRTFDSVLAQAGCAHRGPYPQRDYFLDQI